MDEDKYLAMLDELIERLPEKSKTSERFTVPSPDVIWERRRTILLNFKKIAESLRRPVKIMMSFLGKELAAPITYDEPRLIIQARIDQRSLGAVISKFVNNYVICPTCKGPDTQLIRKRRMLTIKCEICGTETSVKAI
ncbi:MAG: translation initiation factor IF-2 subunit beta [Nitrososphaeria archaeon]|nr:translation initiation factor IF-2 subunit beta [Nitrososphaeria archaeon]NIQ33360.1 translation initiation factor IF-2 subunit beta [Nitrososphaeria archaeon]